MGFKHHTFKTSLTVLLFLFFGFSSTIIQAAPKILIWGDSLSAAYGIPVEKGWVSLMKKELGDKAIIVNGSISGETTQGGLTRLSAALKTHQPDFIIIELGANDGLRGIQPTITKLNLNKMIIQSQASGAKIILLGMKIPPNYGLVYSQKFEAIFADLAKQYKLPFIPFFLSPVIEKLELLQEDELHPTAEAQPLLLDQVLPIITKALQ